MLRYFETIQAKGGTNLNRVLSNYASQCDKTGLAIVITDLFDAKGFERGLDTLVYGNFDVLLLHIVDETEINPQFEGAVRLHDIESTQQRRLTVNRRLLDLYHEKIAEYFKQIEAFCLKRNIEYLRASTVIPFEDLVLRYLRRGFYLN